MSIASLVKRLTKALPAVLAAAPVVIDALKQVGQALKKPKPARAGADSGAAAGAASERLSADSGRGGR